MQQLVPVATGSVTTTTTTTTTAPPAESLLSVAVSGDLAATVKTLYDTLKGNFLAADANLPPFQELKIGDGSIAVKLVGSEALGGNQTYPIFTKKQDGHVVAVYAARLLVAKSPDDYLKALEQFGVLPLCQKSVGYRAWLERLHADRDKTRLVRELYSLITRHSRHPLFLFITFCYLLQVESAKFMDHLKIHTLLKQLSLDPNPSSSVHLLLEPVGHIAVMTVSSCRVCQPALYDDTFDGAAVWKEACLAVPVSERSYVYFHVQDPSGEQILRGYPIPTLGEATCTADTSERRFDVHVFPQRRGRRQDDHGGSRAAF